MLNNFFSVGSLIVAFKIKFKSVLNATLADLENALTAAINGSLAGFPVSAVAIEGNFPYHIAFNSFTVGHSKQEWEAT